MNFHKTKEIFKSPIILLIHGSTWIKADLLHMLKLFELCYNSPNQPTSLYCACDLFVQFSKFGIFWVSLNYSLICLSPLSAEVTICSIAAQSQFACMIPKVYCASALLQVELENMSLKLSLYSQIKCNYLESTDLY